WFRVASGLLQGWFRACSGCFRTAAGLVISLIIIICYAASRYGGFSAVAISEMIFAMVFFGIFMMEMDKQIRVVNWVWSVSPFTIYKRIDVSILLEKGVFSKIILAAPQQMPNKEVGPCFTLKPGPEVNPPVTLPCAGLAQAGGGGGGGGGVCGGPRGQHHVVQHRLCDAKVLRARRFSSAFVRNEPLTSAPTSCSCADPKSGARTAR
uniref:Uncharacterized protein n=1 Tax=Mola mola TaxID=94237 RepID=A0A3Q3XB85_MOLML